jgi:hypothetical protein
LREPPEQLGAPPVATRPQLLPIGSLAPMDFERLCYRLAVVDGEVEHCQLYGVPGQAQEGVDIVVRQSAGYRVIQCKRRRTQIKVGDLVSAVDEFIAGSWRRRANEFVLAISSSVEPTQLADQIEMERGKLAALGIRFTVWDEIGLSTKLKAQRQIVEDFFGAAVAIDFLGPVVPNTAVTATASSRLRKPAPIISCPYVLNPEGRLFGRDATLGRIRSQLDSDRSRVIAIVGVAGAGKSALAWQLFQDLLGEEPRRRLIWHSFYDPEGDLDRFLQQLAHAFDADADDANLVNIVLSNIARTGAVVVLDGFERLLEYSQRALDIGSLGVSGAAERLLGPQLGLGIASFRARKLVLGLVALSNVHLILTSRAIPTELTDHASRPLPGTEVHYLEGLEVDAAIELWSSLGVTTSVPAATLAVDSLAGHALSIIVLGLAARGRDAGGLLTAERVFEIRSRRSPDGSLRDALLASALERQDRDTRILLALVGAMGGSPRLDALEAQDVISDVGQRLADLAAAGLVTIDQVRGVVGAHPLSCEAAAIDLTQSDLRQLSETARAIAGSSYQTLDWERESEKYIEWVTSGDHSDRNEVAALCRGLVSMGKLDEAADLYMSQLNVVFKLSIGANVDAISLLWPMHAAAKATGDIEPQICSMLVHHLAAVGWDEQAQLVAADHPDPDESGELQLALAAVDGRAGRHDDAARRVARALRRARVRVAFAAGYSYGGLQLLAEKWYYDMNGPVTDLVEAECAAARLLTGAGYHSRAALLLLDALESASTLHPCGGCQARVMVEAARLTLSLGDASLASRTADRAVTVASDWAVPVRSVEAEAIRTGADLESGVDLATRSGALLDYQARMATQGFEFCSQAAIAMLDGHPLKSARNGPLARVPLERSSAERLSNWLLDEVARRGKLPTPSASARRDVAEDAQTLEGVLGTIAQSLLSETDWNELFNLPQHMSDAAAKRLTEQVGALPVLVKASSRDNITWGRCAQALEIDPGCLWAHRASAQLAQGRDDDEAAFDHAIEYFRWGGGVGDSCWLLHDLAVTNTQKDRAVDLLTTYAIADHEPHLAMLAAASLRCRQQDWSAAQHLHLTVLAVGRHLAGSADATHAHRAGAIVTTVLAGDDAATPPGAPSGGLDSTPLYAREDDGPGPLEIAWLRFLAEFVRSDGVRSDVSLVPAGLSSEERDELHDIVDRSVAGLARSGRVGAIVKAAADRFVGSREDPVPDAPHI